MKRNFLFHVWLLSGLIAISITGFTGCFYENTKDASHISETELEQLADDADAVVKAYFKEKYNVQAAVTDRSIAGGVFLGPDPSAEPYYILLLVLQMTRIIRCAMPKCTENGRTRK